MPSKSVSDASDVLRGVETLKMGGGVGGVGGSGATACHRTQ